MQYGKEKLEELAKIAEEKGTYEAVALHLGIGATKLYEIRKKNTTLREVLTRAIKRQQFQIWLRRHSSCSTQNKFFVEK